MPWTRGGRHVEQSTSGLVERNAGRKRAKKVSANSATTHQKKAAERSPDVKPGEIEGDEKTIEKEKEKHRK